jgi:hypothetical protein
MRQAAGVGVLLALLAAAPAGAQESPCRLLRLAHADVKLDQDGAPLIPVTIGGGTEYFRLEGSPNSFIFKDDADRLGFGSRHRVSDDGLFIGDQRVVRRRTTDIDIGEVRWRDYEFIPLADKPTGIASIGAFGIDFLFNKSLDIELNPAAGRINFIQANSCARPPWASQGSDLPLDGEGRIPLTLDGKKMRGIIDFSRAQSIMDFVAFDAKAEPTDSGQRRDDRESTPQPPADPQRKPFVHTFQHMIVGEADLTGPAILVGETRDPAAEEAFRTRVKALNPYEFIGPVRREEPVDIVWLGRAELNRLRFYFMFQAHRLFVTPAVSVSAARPVH